LGAFNSAEWLMVTGGTLMRRSGLAAPGVLSGARRCQYVPVRIRWASAATRPGIVTTLSLVLLATAGCESHGVVASEATLTSTAGTIDVQCIDRFDIKIVGFQAAAGFTGRVIVEGPAGEASIVFENPAANDYKAFVHCESSQASVREIEVEDTTLTD
jgi:hypothetical protein